MAASIFSLLIPSIQQESEMGKWSVMPAFIGLWLGVLFLLLIDTVVPHLHKFAQEGEGIKKDSLSKQMMMLLAVAIHNIPEGMAVAVPLISGGMSKFNAVLVTALTGSPTIIGALIGYYIGVMGPTALALSLSFASGAMLYVVFAELLPESILRYKSKMPAVGIFVGIIVGLIIIYV